MRTFLLAAAAFLALIHPAFASERYVAYQTARVTVGTDGRIGKLDWIGSTLSTQMLESLAARVRKVEFEPALVNGVPAEAETTILVRLEAKAQDSGLALNIYGVEEVAGYELTKPPRYPSRELRRGITAEVMLEVEFDGNGRVTAARAADDRSQYDRFLKASLSAARDWIMRPQRVAGVGVPGRAVVPVRFTIEGNREPGAAHGDLKFNDGGSLRVYREDSPELEKPWILADSRLRMRSIEGALDQPSGS